MKIIVRKDEDSTEAEFEISEEQTVQDLKDLIASENFGPIVKEQRLEFDGIRLKNSQLLSKYSFEEGSVVVLKQQSASSSSSAAASDNENEEAAVEDEEAVGDVAAHDGEKTEEAETSEQEPAAE